jgi:voltage-gated sodium channel
MAELPREARRDAPSRDGWNVFDLTVVAASLQPQAGAFAMVARLLRVARLVSVFPELRLIVSDMLRSISSMGHILQSRT